MAESTIVKVKRDGTLSFEDGTAMTALTYTVAYEAGDLSISIPGRTVNLFLDRGVMGATPSIRYGDDQPMTGTFTAHFRDTTESGEATLNDILCQTGYVASNWVSTMGTNGEVFTVTLIWTIEGTDHGDAADHTITLNYCYVTGSISEGDPNTLSLQFTSYDLYPTVT